MKTLKNFAKKLMALVATVALVVLPTMNANAAPQTVTYQNSPYTGRYIAGFHFHFKRAEGSGTPLYCTRRIGLFIKKWIPCKKHNW